MVPVRRLVAIVASVLWTIGPAAPLVAQQRDADELILHAYTLRYQQAIEAIPLIQPLLSARHARSTSSRGSPYSPTLGTPTAQRRPDISAEGSQQQHAVG